MNIAEQKVQLIKAIADCQDPRLLEAIAGILALQNTAPPAPLQAGQRARPAVEDQEQSTLDIQKEIDDTFLAF